MRTKIKVVGIGNRMSGVSKKNGKAYDFLPVSFVYQDPNFNGFRAATATIGGPMLDAADWSRWLTSVRFSITPGTTTLLLTAFCDG